MDNENNKVEFDSVFLEFDDGSDEPVKETPIEDEHTELVIKGKTARMSIDELQKRLDETQSIHVNDEN